MATRSVIAMQYEDGSSRSIYCHYDGYPQRMLPILFDHYATVEQVDELLVYGSRPILTSDVAENGDAPCLLDADGERIHDDAQSLAETVMADDAEYVYVFSVADRQWNMERR